MIAPTLTELADGFGCSIIPVKLDKKPSWTHLPQRYDETEKRMRGQWKPFQQRKPTTDEMSRWVKANVPAFAIVTGEISNRVVFDFDGPDGVALAEKWGVRAHRKTGSGGLHWDVEYPGWFVPTLNGKAKAELGRRWPGLDVKGDGGYCIAVGRNEKGPYEWLRGPEPDPAKSVPAEVWEFLREYSQPKASAPVNGGGDQPVRYAVPDALRVDSGLLIQKALNAAGAAGRNNAGFDLACQSRDNGYTEDEVVIIMRNYRSRAAAVNTKGQHEPYTDTEISATVREVFSKAAREPWAPKTRTRFHPERAPVSSHGTGMPQRAGPQQNDPSGEGATCGDQVDLLDYLPNDHGNACRLIALYGQDIRFCHALRKWLVWDGMRWAVDDTDRVRELAKRTMLEFLRQAIDKHAGEQAEKFARGTLDARRISSLLSMAESQVFVRPIDLDTNPYLLNFQNGTVDLRTGRLREQDRCDFITKLIHHDYVPEASCLLWRSFLDRIMGGGPDAGEVDLDRASRLTEYLQRAFGYSLTGCTIEKTVFIVFGDGNNGKSTMLSTFRQIVDEYATLLQCDSLMVRQESNNTQADLADLRGARFVQTSEVEEGQRLAQGKLKRITQGMGKIKAVRQYENPVEFPETHKLWMDTNRKPNIKDADDKATFNRLHPIPFAVQIPKEQIDKEMPDKLLREAEGILAWAVEGARLWNESGLNKPSEVDAANDEWRSISDRIGRFIDERCLTGDVLRVAAAALYGEYRRWAEAGGERALTSTAFGLKLPDRGFAKKHTDKGWFYLGLSLRSEVNGEGRYDGA
jgi:putative DNA primase/helicase